MKGNNLRRCLTLLPLTMALLLVTGCGRETRSQDTGETQIAAAPASGDGQRWFSAAQVAQGTAVFGQHCASCHGEQAQGLTGDWQTRQADGSFPPPPLNGTAHAWHHPLVMLVQTIETGGVPYGGQMPPFADVLNDQEKLAAIAYFQSFWSEEIYDAWLDRGGLE